MPISESDKKVLLERLEKARIAKQAKAAEKKGATEKKALAPVPAPALRHQRNLPRRSHYPIAIARKRLLCLKRRRPRKRICHI